MSHKILVIAENEVGRIVESLFEIARRLKIADLQAVLVNEAGAADDLARDKSADFVAAIIDVDTTFSTSLLTKARFAGHIVVLTGDEHRICFEQNMTTFNRTRFGIASGVCSLLRNLGLVPDDEPEDTGGIVDERIRDWDSVPKAAVEAIEAVPTTRS